ncbi:transporter substrate-binding domain-containing protein [Paenibacillus barengoltzii]|uniref:Polar amino acid transport system substrate-binding protein n=1 Tax=Paenibacillus barengoltzii G22 TaxID=1235795 RepID=R9L8R0_9BACL|nr:transporter substrate-binding domain-containing protein [Paenibacillus barengoltzii]EOS54953.1 polar amino acid transport system substrate-binding protein [Paenibacillus barengoltzii G22]
MKRWLSAAAVLVLAGALAGCGAGASGGTEGKDTAASAASGSGEVKKIIVGTGTGFPKVCFIDENGKLTGFDVELVREIDRRLAEYEFEFQTQEFSNLLLSLETKKIDFVAHEMEKNPERAEKYLFNKEPYAHWRNKIIVAKDNHTIHSLDDLKGKKVLTSPTSAEAQILENYNKENNNAIEIVYQSGAANDTVSQIISGRVEATLGADFSLSLIDPQGKLKTTGEDLSEADILFVFRKDDPEGQKLADAIDEVIKELKADGTLSKLSKEWLGEDFTSDN